MVKSKKMEVHFSSEKSEWETPPEFFDSLNYIFDFDWDACATQQNSKCGPCYWSIANDALTQEWGTQKIWMNPPYGRGIGKWVKKAYEESLKGALVVCLLPARPDTQWWKICKKGTIKFIEGRLKFVGAESSAPFPSAIVIFGSIFNT